MGNGSFSYSKAKTVSVRQRLHIAFITFFSLEATDLASINRQFLSSAAPRTLKRRPNVATIHT